MNGEANKPLSIGEDGLRRWLDRQEVLSSTVSQLRKDLSLSAAELVEPPGDEGAFEALRAQVLAALDRWQGADSASLSRAINRIDLTEGQVNAAMGRGGFQELAGAMVLRALQKVLTRLRFAGRY
ncbi:MAG: hypothetical protein JNM49_02880 [Flavobacteriales bacterium]|nr:hypothetical protein [Flavobacteriales bacterium]